MPVLSREELIIMIAVVLGITFALGWLGRLVFERLNTNGPIASEEAMARMAAAEEELGNRIREFAATEAQYANAYAQLEAELDAAMSGLGEARRELQTYKNPR